MDANRTVPPGELKSELALLALRSTERDPGQKLAWVNSICALFLLIGVVGFKPGAIDLTPPPPLEETAAVLVEPVIPPPQAAEEQNQDPADAAQTEAPPLVLVTPDSPSINFAVPTIGNVLVPNALAKAPPAAPLRPVAPLRRLPVVLTSTGGGGERPMPPYPKIALEQAEQGAVVLQMTVDDAGAIAQIEVKQSSGFPLLDRSALDFVKRHWIVPPASNTRVFETTINYKLNL